MDDKKLVEVKVNKELKEECDSLFASLGLDTSTAINIFMAASLRDMGIPFHVGLDPFEDGFSKYYRHCDDCDCDCDCECDDCTCNKD